MEINGILNYVYSFFYEWLYGNAPIDVLESTSIDFTMILSFILVLVAVFFTFRLVTSLIKLVYNMFRLDM